jgi:hypothetical protein
MPAAILIGPYTFLTKGMRDMSEGDFMASEPISVLDADPSTADDTVSLLEAAARMAQLAAVAAELSAIFMQAGRREFRGEEPYAPGEPALVAQLLDRRNRLVRSVHR